MIRNSSVITENALHPAGNVTTMMIAVTTVMNKIVVCISWVIVSKKLCAVVSSGVGKTDIIKRIYSS